MSFAQIQLIRVILAEIIFIIVPFLAVFRREWRYSMSKTTGILMGYLFFVYFLGLTCFSPFLSRPWLELAWSWTRNVLPWREPDSVYSGRPRVPVSWPP